MEEFFDEDGPCLDPACPIDGEHDHGVMRRELSVSDPGIDHPRIPDPVRADAEAAVVRLLRGIQRAGPQAIAEYVTHAVLTRPAVQNVLAALREIRDECGPCYCVGPNEPAPEYECPHREVHIARSALVRWMDKGEIRYPVMANEKGELPRDAVFCTEPRPPIRLMKIPEGVQPLLSRDMTPWGYIKDWAVRFRCAVLGHR